VFKAIKNYLRQIKYLKEFRREIRAILLKLNATLTIPSKERETYSKIWNALNQTSLENFEQESASFPTEINQNQVRKYFEQTSHYRIIDLESVSEKEQRFLEKVGLSLTYLKQNQKLVNKEGISEEKTLERGELSELLQLAVEEGCIYACCPSTGRILKSNHSFVNSFRSGLVFYRFVANEVFYLICGHSLTKVYLYFPRLELNIWLAPNSKEYKNNKMKILKEMSTDLCILMVSNWLKIKSYLLHTGEAKKAALIPVLYPSPWHQVMNYFSPIYKLYETGYWHQIDRFLLCDREPESNYGNLDEIFNEIPFERIKLPYLQDEILENNLFVFNIAFELDRHYTSDNLANHIYQVCLRKCSSAFLAEVKEAKAKCFPLIWINFRLHRRTWMSQEEGIANIIKNLAANFPNLGVVFDGFSRIDIGGKLLFNPQEETIIKQEKELVNRVQGLLPEGIKVYDIIGCPMHEAIVWGYAIDVYFVTVGSGLIKVRLPNKPGVVHSGSLYYQLKGHNEMRENCIFPVPVPEHHIVKVSPPSTREDHMDYDFDWRVAYEELFKIASSLKREES
jgi:hypothetical protein